MRQYNAFDDHGFLIENHRGRGWGRKAIAFVEKAARALGIRSLAFGGCAKPLRAS
jgi:GNAT superfamily N-acetyltransferase